MRLGWGKEERLPQTTGTHGGNAEPKTQVKRVTGFSPGEKCHLHAAEHKRKIPVLRGIHHSRKGNCLHSSCWVWPKRSLKQVNNRLYGYFNIFQSGFCLKSLAAKSQWNSNVLKESGRLENRLMGKLLKNKTESHPAGLAWEDIVLPPPLDTYVPNSCNCRCLAPVLLLHLHSCLGITTDPEDQIPPPSASRRHEGCAAPASLLSLPWVFLEMSQSRRAQGAWLLL